MDGLFGGLKRNDILIVIWPVFNSLPWSRAMINKVHQFGAKLVYLIDDFVSWRSWADLPDTMNAEEKALYKQKYWNVNEVQLLKHADGLILHSKEMETRLRKQARLADETLTDNVTYFGANGYEATYFQWPRGYDQGIDYAGTLQKARFLLEMPESLHINVFGKVPKDIANADHRPANVNFNGFVDPEAVVQMLKGSYGLVWDSDSYPGVTGILGDYQRYNTPAKFTLYLAANEPVIVWDQSPLARFVKGNHIGFAIPDLSVLPETIAQVTQDQYKEMLHNVQRVGGLIREGYFMKKSMIDIQAKVLGIVPAN